MSNDLFEILTLRAFRVSPKRKTTYGLELIIFVVLLYLLTRHDLLAPIPYASKAAWVAVVYLGAHLLLLSIQIPFISTYRKRRKLVKEDRDNFVIGTHALVRVLSLIAVVVGVFIIFDLQVVPVLTSLGLFSVAIVWVGKEYISNFIDSFILMFTNDFQIGEYIRVDETTKGVIQNITFRDTQIRTDDGYTLFVPNSNLVHHEVVNYSKTHYKRISIPFAMKRDRSRDLPAFEAKTKQDLALAFPELVSEDKVEVRAIEIRSEEVLLSLEVSVSAYNFSIEERVRKWFATYLLASDGGARS